MLIPRRTGVGGGGGGASYFVDLLDTPNTFLSQALKRIRVNSSETGLEFVSEPYLYAPDYGVTGDGVTDDTTAIQAMIDSIPTSGGIRCIFFPDPLVAYLINGQINVNKSNIKILGISKYSTYFKLKDSSTITTKNSIFYVTGTNVKFSSIYIDGNSVNNSSKIVSGIYGYDSSGIDIDDVQISSVTNFGIILQGTTSPLTKFSITNSLITNTGWYGVIVFYGTRGYILGNDIISTGGSGLTLYPSITNPLNVSSYIFVQGNYVNKAIPPTVILPGWLSGEMGGLLQLGGGEDLNIDTNIFWDCSATGSDGIMITSCWNSVYAPYVATYPASDYWKRIKINNNLVALSSYFGIDCPPDSTITNNTVYKAGATAIAVEAGSNWGATSLHHVTISDNRIIDPFENGVHIYDGAFALEGQTAGCSLDDITITGNAVYDTRGTKLTNYAIFLKSTPFNIPITNVNVHSNNFKGVGLGTLHVSGITTYMSDIHIEDNITIDPIVTLTVNSATPSIIGRDLFITANTSPTTITSFLDGYNGQKIEVIIGDTNTSFNSSGNIVAKTTTPSLNDCIRYIYSTTTTKWHEVN